MKKRAGKILVSWVSVTGMWLLLHTVSLFPEKAIYALGRMLSSIYYNIAHRNRKLALENLKIALGDELKAKQRKEIARESFRTMGSIVLDTIRFKDFSADKIKELISIDGIEYLKTAFKKNKGVIVVSAHMGSFTLIGSRLSVEGYKATFVARHARNKKIEQIIMGFCRQVGQKIIFNRPILTCMRRSIKVLSRNEILIIELDQNFGTEGLEVNFFGRPAMVATGPIKLSFSTGAVILPMFIIRKNDLSHVVKIEPPIEIYGCSDEDKDIKGNLQQIIDVIETYIRRYPGQWVNWIHKRWQTPQK